MDLTPELRSRLEHVMSKKAGLDLVEDVVQGKLDGNLLVEAALAGTERYSVKAAWVLRDLSLANPDLFVPYYERIILVANEVNADNITRDLFKVIMNIPVQVEFEGLLIDVAFRQLERLGAAVAVKYYSMNILMSYISKYPELGPEVLSLLELQKDLGTNAFRVQAKKAIESLRSL